MSKALTLARLDAIVRKLRAAAEPDMRRVEMDIMVYGTACYRIDPDGSFHHAPVLEVLPEDATGK